MIFLKLVIIFLAFLSTHEPSNRNTLKVERKEERKEEKKTEKEKIKIFPKPFLVFCTITVREAISEFLPGKGNSPT